MYHVQAYVSWGVQAYKPLKLAVQHKISVEEEFINDTGRGIFTTSCTSGTDRSGQRLEEQPENKMHPNFSMKLL